MNEEPAQREAENLLALPSPPTAFLCSSIAQANGVRRACARHGRRIGHDIAVIAHDDRLHGLRGENFDPPLTTTQSPIGDAGSRIVELAVTAIRQPNAPLPN